MKRNIPKSLKPLVRVIAGPDSLDNRNLHEAIEIASMEINGEKCVYGVRTVGLKSRTNFDSLNTPGGYMGHDFEIIMYNFDVYGYGGNRDKLIQLPTVSLAKEIYRQTKVLCATEIMLPAIQLPCIAREFSDAPFMIWNPAVNQLGWSIRQMAGFCKEYPWTLGIKNGKWLGTDVTIAETPKFIGKTSIESTWDGLVDWAKPANETILIQRGCDLPDKGNFRNIPIHFTAMRTKIRNPGIKLLFDPSHSLGPKMKDEIHPFTINAMKMLMPNGTPLYDGILLEVGTSFCDTDQHITVKEFKKFMQELSEIRTFETTPTVFQGTYDSSKEFK